MIASDCPVKAKQAATALALTREKLTWTRLDGVEYGWLESATRRTPRKADFPQVQLLPAFDEYTVAYQDRSLLVERGKVSKMGLLSPAVLLDGRVIGTWKRALDKQCVTVKTALSRKLSAAESAALLATVKSYGEFLGLDARLAR